MIVYRPGTDGLQKICINIRTPRVMLERIAPELSQLRLFLVEKEFFVANDSPKLAILLSERLQLTWVRHRASRAAGQVDGMENEFRDRDAMRLCDFV